MVDERLHSRLAAVLAAQNWQSLSAPQLSAWPVIATGAHTLLTAPTGHGKTEAALLPVIDRLLRERDILERGGKPWPIGFKVLYVTPLRALNRDLMGRLESWAEALDLKVGVRHGDTSPAERSRQSRAPPDILITTPETVQLLLYGDTLRRHLGTVRFVILDEVHELASSERGSQLSIALERIEEVIAQPDALRWAKAKERPGPSKLSAKPGGGFQRIGLSATVAETAPVARFLAGASREAEIVTVATAKAQKLDVITFDETEDDAVRAATFASTPTAMAQVRTVREIVMQHERVLIFCNTRDQAELIASRSALMDEELGTPAVMGLHHGSLSADFRADIEDQFKQGKLRAMVATSSLELGIDIGEIDHVVQVGSPRSIARMVQRIGRAGHRIGATSFGTIIASGPEEFLECVAIARRGSEGNLEPLAMREMPLVALANQIVALSNEYSGLNPEWCMQLVQRAAPFAELDEGLFMATWETLLDVKTLFADEEKSHHIGRSGRGRKHFLEHISLIADERKFRVIDESTKRSIGTVDDGFIAAGLHPGASFIMAGRSWRVLEVQNDVQKVRVAPAKELAGTPQWSGSQLPVSREVATDVARLRGAIARGTELIPEAAAPIEAHKAVGLQVPTNLVVTLEQGRQTVVANVALGTRGNDALGRITAALLQQRIGGITFDSDAYRISWRGKLRAEQVADVWNSLDPDTLDLLLARVLRDESIVKHHLVQVAKQFGALPKEFDPTRITNKKMAELWERIALQEETLERLIHDRFDLVATADFLRDLAAGKIELVHQAIGPISQLGQEKNRMVAVPRSDEKLLLEVRRRIEGSDVLLACTQCGWANPMIVAEVPARPRCRRCSSNQIACLRPWDDEKAKLLSRSQASLSLEQRGECKGMHRNAALIAAYGPTAARALVGRGVGPATAGRILQKSADIENPVFWREVLQAELDFARTNAFWSR